MNLLSHWIISCTTGLFGCSFRPIYPVTRIILKCMYSQYEAVFQCYSMLFVSVMVVGHAMFGVSENKLMLWFDDFYHSKLWKYWFYRNLMNWTKLKNSDLQHSVTNKNKTKQTTKQPPPPPPPPPPPLPPEQYLSCWINFRKSSTTNPIKIYKYIW